MSVIKRKKDKWRWLICNCFHDIISIAWYFMEISAFRRHGTAQRWLSSWAIVRNVQKRAFVINAIQVRISQFLRKIKSEIFYRRCCRRYHPRESLAGSSLRHRTFRISLRKRKWKPRDHLRHFVTQRFEPRKMPVSVHFSSKWNVMKCHR